MAGTPLAGTFARLAPHGAHLTSRTEPGWSTTLQLAGPQLDEALGIAGRSLGTDRPDISGQRLVELVAWRLAVPAAAALLAERRLPDLSARNTLVWIGDEPPDGIGTALRSPSFYALPTDPDASRATVVPDETALLGVLRETLERDHVAPLAQAVNDATQRPLRALRRSATDRLVAAIVWIGELTGHRDRACELARAVTDGHAEVRMLQAGEAEMLLHVREGCCLYYRVPGGTKCWSCPLLCDDERRALVAGDSSPAGLVSLGGVDQEAPPPAARRDA